MRRTALVVAAMLALMFVAALAEAQLVYNASALLFEQDLATGYDVTVSYTVEVWADPPDFEAGQPLMTFSVPKGEVVVESEGPPVLYKLALPPLPAGRSYRFRLIAVAQGGAVSPPSNVTPQTSRYSICVNAAGTITPMTISASFGSLAAGQFGSATVDVESPQPVHSVSIDFLGDGLPAYYFSTDADLRGSRPFPIGPLPRAGTYRAVIDAVDERGCRVQYADLLATVK